MKKDNLPLILIIVCVVFIILNFIFASNEMSAGFWLRIISSMLGILAMVLTIRERKKQRKNNSE
jgi:asparagine N-glycosylation enzyme membrane subunit Stt3